MSKHGPVPLHRALAGIVQHRYHRTWCAAMIEGRDHPAFPDHERMIKVYDSLLVQLMMFKPAGGPFGWSLQLKPDQCARKGHRMIDRLVFTLEYQHGRENTHHTVTVRPCIVNGLFIEVSGQNRDNCKVKILEYFQAALEQQIRRDDFPTLWSFLNEVPYAPTPP